MTAGRTDAVSPRLPANLQHERAGVLAVATELNRLGLIWRETPMADVPPVPSMAAAAGATAMPVEEPIVEAPPSVTLVTEFPVREPDFNLDSLVQLARARHPALDAMRRAGATARIAAAIPFLVVVPNTRENGDDRRRVDVAEDAHVLDDRIDQHALEGLPVLHGEREGERRGLHLGRTLQDAETARDRGDLGQTEVLADLAGDLRDGRRGRTP